jgi:hypothetical protein
MQEIKETLGHIVIMQMLVAAVLVDRWANEK